MQILKNLYQTGGDLMGLTFDLQDALWNDANSYALQTDDGIIMFDCGCGDTLPQIFNNMKYWGLDPENIKYCVFTHPHFDHTGGAYLLKKQGVKIVAIKETAEAMAAADERCAGYLYHKKFNAVETDIIVSDEETVELLGVKFKVGHYPGHSMGCTAYSFSHEGKDIVVSGDIIGTLLAGDFGWDGSFDFDKKIYTESLRRFAKLDPDIMLPGHGMIYFHKPQWRVESAYNSALIQWR